MVMTNHAMKQSPSGHHGYCGLASWTRSDKATLIEQKGLGENSSGYLVAMRL
jgi:hypothetical protein